jgi:hypothetical protein
MKKVVIILALMLTSTLAFAQDAPAPAPAAEEPSSNLAIGVDVVYPYLWRGIRLNANKVAFQPYASYALTDKLTAGVWGTTNLSSEANAYNEFDWYLSYQASSVVKITLSDYYYNNTKKSELTRTNYWDYGKTGSQAIDLSVALNFSDKGVPLDFQWNTLIAGNDYNASGDRNFSSYTELGYTQSIESAGVDLRFFAGAILSKPSAYYLVDGFKFTNVGLNVSKAIKFSESFSLPVFVRYTYNENGNYNKDGELKKSFVSGGMTFTIK